MENLIKLTFKPGEILIHENDVSRKLFILKKGKVRVFKNYMNGKVTLAVLGPGEIFGELSFFDSKPRSASCEALTDVFVDCIDGEALNDEIKTLPKWIHLIFRCVATRFRDIDQKMTVLQSLSNFQKKTMSKDSVGNTIYTDLLRITKIFKMILQNQGNSSNKTDLIRDLEHTVGQSFVSPKAYLTALFEHDFVCREEYDNHKTYNVDQEALDGFEKFLTTQYSNDTCTLLTHHAIGMLRNIISYIEEDNHQEADQLVRLPSDALAFDAEDEEMNIGFTQIKRVKLIQVHNDGIYINPPQVIELYKYYSVVKSFDHTVVYSD